MTDAIESVTRTIWRQGTLTTDTDTVVAEVPVALVYNGVSHVVMMATPADLEDPVSYTHLTLPTIVRECRSRWSP
mgnify:CR=1 FL=1